MAITDILQTLKQDLPVVFDEHMLLSKLDTIAKTEKITKPTRKRLIKSPTKIQIHWQKKTIRDLYTFRDDYDQMDLLSAWTSRLTYLSHYSALYYHDLVDQQPREHFLSHEVRTHKNAKDNTLNTDLLRQVFMKDYRTQQNFCFFNGVKFHFLERANTENVGLDTIALPTHDGREHAQLRLTGIERTLIDSVVSPQYSGGMSVVRQCFSRAEIDITRMSNTYMAMGYLYPYWQTIGFLLEQAKGQEISSRWAAIFGPPTMDFFFDRNVRDDWKLNQRWRLFLPSGV